MGFEVIVRPAVFPNIRPAPPRVPASVGNDPTQGLAVLSGGGAKFVGIKYSWQASYSQSGSHREKRRQFDKQRVYQVNPDKTINKNNYVDVETLKKQRFEAGDGPYKILYEIPVPADNIETLKTDVTRDVEDTGPIDE